MTSHRTLHHVGPACQLFTAFNFQSNFIGELGVESGIQIEHGAALVKEYLLVSLLHDSMTLRHNATQNDWRYTDPHYDRFMNLMISITRRRNHCFLYFVSYTSYVPLSVSYDLVPT